MVNTGQPSEACRQCRVRRVKCDTTKPACGNCIRLGIGCPGYPEPPGITFRDDTAKVQARATRMYRNLQTRAEEQGTRDSTSSESDLESDDVQHSRRQLSASTKSRNSSKVARRTSKSASPDKTTVESINTLRGLLQKSGYAAYLDRLSDAILLYPSAHRPLRASVELLALSILANSSASARDETYTAIENMRSKVTKEMTTALDQLKNGSGSYEQTLLAVEVTLLVDCYSNFPESSVADLEAGIRTHSDGMFAIVNHGGMALLETELGRNIYVNVFMRHIHTYSPLEYLPPIPGPEDAVEVVLRNHPVSTPELRFLPLLRDSFNLRRQVMQTFRHQPELVNLELLGEIQLAIERLRYSFEALWTKLPAAQKYGGSSILRWVIHAHWVHRILIEDIQIRCLRALQEIKAHSQISSGEIATSIAKAQFAVSSICQGLPYSFTEADLPTDDEEVPTFQDVLFAWHGHDPLLICSMVDILSEEQHAGIFCARNACARAAGLKQPLVTLPRTLLKIDWYLPLMSSTCSGLSGSLSVLH